MAKELGNIYRSKNIPKEVWSRYGTEEWQPFLENQIIFANPMSTNNFATVRLWCSGNFQGYYIILGHRLMCQYESDMV
jgi:hypothetical protein